MDVNFSEWLERRLRIWREKGLMRRMYWVEGGSAGRIRHGDDVYENFGSNDYLGLAYDERLRSAALDSLRVKENSFGAGAARLMTGNARIWEEAEERLARFKGCDAGLIFSSGYAMALGVIPALVERGDFLVLDRKAHACLIDGARLSEAVVRTYPHNDMEALEDLLMRIRERYPTARIGIITESLFSMDGDWAPLRRIVELKKRYGAWLLVDEAHATGIYGERRRGLLELQKVESEVEVQVGTLGKALGVSGGYVVGKRELIEYLINHARSFMFSTGLCPVLAAALIRSIEIVESDETGMELFKMLWGNVYDFKRLLYGDSAMPPAAPIFPVMIGDERECVRVMDDLMRRKLWVPAVRYPSVGKGRARLRISITAAHRKDAMENLANALFELKVLSKEL
jgi:glycine C-acetyltransferase/8-amino-7-oxononanoate synthase